MTLSHMPIHYFYVIFEEVSILILSQFGIGLLFCLFTVVLKLLKSSRAWECKAT